VCVCVYCAMEYYIFLLDRIRLKRKFCNGRWYTHVDIPSSSETAAVNARATLLQQRGQKSGGKRTRSLWKKKNKDNNIIMYYTRTLYTMG